MTSESNTDPRRITPRGGQLRRDRRESFGFTLEGHRFYIHVCDSAIDIRDTELQRQILEAYRQAVTEDKGPIEPSPENLAEGAATQMILSRSQAGNLMLTFYLDYNYENERSIPLAYNKIAPSGHRPGGREA